MRYVVDLYVVILTEKNDHCQMCAYLISKMNTRHSSNTIHSIAHGYHVYGDNFFKSVRGRSSYSVFIPSEVCLKTKKNSLYRKDGTKNEYVRLGCGICVVENAMETIRTCYAGIDDSRVCGEEMNAGGKCGLK